jgi:hypothetical protein
MKRSRVVQLTLVSSVASMLLGCREKPTRYCVDENQAVADERKCEQSGPSGGAYGAYHWYYGGARGQVPEGTRLSGGSTVAPEGGFSEPSGRGVIGAAGEDASGGHGGGEAGE